MRKRIREMDIDELGKFCLQKSESIEEKLERIRSGETPPQKDNGELSMSNREGNISNRENENPNKNLGDLQNG